MEVIIKKTSNPKKKFSAVIDGKKTIHFGQVGASDYLHHKNDEMKQLYIKRHMKNEDWSNPLTSGFWSKHLLWNKKTIDDSIADINKKYNIVAKIK